MGATRADFIRRCTYRLVVSAVSKCDRGEGNREEFFCLNHSPGRKQNRTGVSDLLRGLSPDNHILYNSLTAIFFPGSDTKK